MSSIPQIFMRCDLADDPRVLHVAAATGATPAHVVGALHYFWSQAYTKGKAGKVSGLTESALEARVGIKGLVKALKQRKHPKIDWCREAPDGSLIMPGADDKFSASARDRDTAYERLRKAKWRAQQNAMEREIEDLNQEAKCPGHVPDCPGQNGTVPTVKQSRVKQGSSKAMQSYVKQQQSKASADRDDPGNPADADADAAEVSAPGSAAALAPNKPAPHGTAGDVFRALLLLGVQEPRLSEFRALSGITAAFVNDLNRRKLAGKKNTGWAIRAIENQFGIPPR